MRKLWDGVVVFAVICSMTSCGSTPSVATFETSKPRFVNMTPNPDSDVTPLWERQINQAADWIGKGYHGVPGAGIPDLDGNIVSTPSPELDAKVHQVASSLRGIIVESRPDIPATEINAIPGCRNCPYNDPTGFIYCPSNRRAAKYCQAYTPEYGHIVIPAGHPEYFGPWEIMITLLHYCGKDPQNM